MIQMLKEISLLDCDKNSLVDLNTIDIDNDNSKEIKILDYITQINNPYLFRVGDIAVKLVFKEDGRSLQDELKKLISANLAS